MLSLITTEQSGLALINSTDMTIRNLPHKVNTVACENAAVFIKPAHKPGKPVANKGRTEQSQ